MKTFRFPIGRLTSANKIKALKIIKEAKKLYKNGIL